MFSMRELRLLLPILFPLLLFVITPSVIFAGGTAEMNLDGSIELQETNPESNDFELKLDGFEISAEKLNEFCHSISDNVFEYTYDGSSLKMRLRVEGLPKTYLNSTTQTQHLNLMQKEIARVINFYKN